AEPFYFGTYFPPEPRHGMPSFLQVLQGVHQACSRETPPPPLPLRFLNSLGPFSSNTARSCCVDMTTPSGVHLKTS
ncbi:hypothetical protein, partial [Streptomyces sp. NPDC003299]